VLKITVLGLGYVGTTASGPVAAGGAVPGIDRDRLASLRSDNVPLCAPGLEACVAEEVRSGRSRFLHRDDGDEPLGTAAMWALGFEYAGVGRTGLPVQSSWRTRSA
jgi:hypothetical protein